MIRETIITREIDGEEVEIPIMVTYSITPGRPARFYLNNGDPGYPEEPPEIDLTWFSRVDGGESIDITDDETDRIADEILEEYDGREDRY